MVPICGVIYSKVRNQKWIELADGASNTNLAVAAILSDLYSDFQSIRVVFTFETQT